MKISKSLKIGIVAGVCAVLSIAYPVVANPGSESDPLISLSYIEKDLIPRIEKMIEENGSNGSIANDTFKVVSVKNGEKVICKSGTELILRMGTATIIATEKGGLADTTMGCDLANGTVMPSNHLLIVPLDDGRGIMATSEVLVMIKGGYEIK